MSGEIVAKMDEEDGVLDDSVFNNFVPVPIPVPNEDSAVVDVLARMQADTAPVAWPCIDGVPVNEFQSPGYIARAFPTLYPTGAADLRFVMAGFNSRSRQYAPQPR